MKTLDRIIRVLIAFTCLTLVITGTTTGAFGVVLLLFAGIMFATGMTSFCPIYKILGIRTKV